MKQTIAIFGASGHVGKIVVADALAQGHTVIAFVHNHPQITDHPQLTIMQGDIHNPEDVSKAIDGSDAVISTLGSWGTPQKDIVSAAIKNIIPAMQAANISRIVTLTGADARAANDRISIVHRLTHFTLGIIGGKVLRDSEEHLSLLEKSGLDWTVIRSPIMTNSRSRVYQLNDTRPLPWETISRHAVASAVLKEVGHDHHSQQALFIKQ